MVRIATSEKVGGGGSGLTQDSYHTMRVGDAMGEKERAQALHAIMVLSLEIGQRGGLAAPIVTQAQKILDVNNKHREEAESHIRSARNGGDWQGQRGNVVRQAMKRVIDAIEYGDLPPGRKSKEYRRLVDRAKKVLEKAGETSDYMSADSGASFGMEHSETVPERRVQPAAMAGNDKLLDSLLDEEEGEGENGSLIATLMDEEEEEEVNQPGAGLRLAPMAGGAEPMSHMDGSAEGETSAQATQVMEAETEQASPTVEEDDKIGDEESDDDPADQLLALQKQVAELTKAIKHEEEMAGEDLDEDEFVEDEFIEEDIPETRMRGRRSSSAAPMATRESTVRTASRAAPARRAMAAAPVASSKSRRVQEEDEEEDDDVMEGGRRNSTLDTYRLLLETVWVDDLLDPAEVDLLRRKRIELGIDFETHLKMTREMLGGLD